MSAAMDAAMYMILHPRETRPVRHEQGDSVETYLRKYKQNIEAEVWSLVSSGGRQAVNAVVRNNVIVSVFSAGVRIPCKQLQFSLLVLNGHLCLVTRARGDGMGFQEGLRLRGGPRLIGFVKP